MHRFPASLFLILSLGLAQCALARPIRIAVDAEFSVPSSTSAQAIHNGAQVAVDEINAAGGVLGRKLELIKRDNRGVPARAANNLRELAADPDVVAVLCGKFSPVAVELLPEIHRLGMPYLDPWAAADPITDNGYTPSYVFRLSLRDSAAMQVMLQHAAWRGAHKVGLLLPYSEWGRSNLRAAQSQAARASRPEIVAFDWYHWGEQSLIPHYRKLAAAGVGAVILVANEQEGAVLINELAALPRAQRLPIVAHWGITSGQFFRAAKKALPQVDLAVVQTYTFIGKHDPVSARLLSGLKTLTGNGDARRVDSPNGVAHAYDLVHFLARAIEKAGSSERPAVRDALENLGSYTGATRHYERPFTRQRHDALGVEDVFMARFAADGAIEPLPGGGR